MYHTDITPFLKNSWKKDERSTEEGEKTLVLKRFAGGRLEEGAKRKGNCFLVGGQ